MGVLEARGGFDLATEPVGAERRGERGTEHLEGHAALMLEVEREVHRGHATMTELALEHVPVLQHGGQGWGRSCPGWESGMDGGPVASAGPCP